MAPCAVHRDTDELSAQILELGKNFVIERHLVAGAILGTKLSFSLCWIDRHRFRIKCKLRVAWVHPF
jgi:hypothetical protein